MYCRNIQKCLYNNIDFGLMKCTRLYICVQWRHSSRLQLINDDRLSAVNDIDVACREAYNTRIEIRDVGSTLLAQLRRIHTPHASSVCD